MSRGTDSEFEKWLMQRPLSVQALATEFPPRDFASFVLDGETVFLLGYTENDQLILSDIDPKANAAKAMKHRFLVCASHLRTARATQ